MHNDRRDGLGLIPMLVLAAIGWDAQAKGRNPFIAIIKAIVLFWVVIIVLALFAIKNQKPEESSAPAVASLPNAAVVPRQEPEPRLPDVQQTDQLWILVTDADVTERPSEGMTPIARVHSGRSIHVLGTVT